MKRLASITLALSLLALLIVLAAPAFAAVDVVNQSGETVRLEIRAPGGTFLGTFQLRPGESTPAGGTYKDVTITAKTPDGQTQLASGTFRSGDRVALVKEGGNFVFRKR